MQRFIFSFLLIFFLGLFPSLAEYSKALEDDAKKGNVQAMIDLGDAYMNGEGVKKNPKEAVKWYEKAAKENSSLAYERLVEAYESWDKVEKNPKKVEQWLKKGSKAGIPSMLFRYGLQSLADGYGYRAASNFSKAAENGFSKAEPYAAFALAINNYPDYPMAYYYAERALKNENLSDEEKSMANGAAALALIEMNREIQYWMPYLEKTDNPEIILKIAMKIPPIWDVAQQLKAGKKLVEYNDQWQKNDVFSPVINYDRNKLLSKIRENTEEYYFVKAMKDYEDLNFQSSFENIVKAAELRNPLASIIVSTAYMPNDRIAQYFGIIPDNQGIINCLEASGLVFDNIWVNILSRMVIDNFRSQDEGKYKEYMYFADVKSNTQCSLNSLYQNNRQLETQIAGLKDILDRSKIARKHANSIIYNRYANTISINPLLEPAYKEFREKYEKGTEEIKQNHPQNENEIISFYIQKGLEFFNKALETNDPSLKDTYNSLATDFILAPKNIIIEDIPHLLLYVSYVRYPNPDLAMEMLNNLLDNQPDETVNYLASPKGINVANHFYDNDRYTIINFYKDLLKQNVSEDTKMNVRKFVHKKFNEAI